MRTEGIAFLGHARPEIKTTASGQYQLTLLLMAEISPRRREAWRVTWTGDAARAFWTDNHPLLVPGQPIRAVLERARSHATSSKPPQSETHADVVSLALAPRRGEADPTRSPEHAEQQAA